MLRHRPVLTAAAAVLAVAGILHPVGPAAADLPKPDPDAPAAVLLNEVANGDARGDANSFVELRNWGDEPVDLTGWELYRCSVNGLRSNVGRVESDLRGVVLEPGEIRTISRIGMPGDAHIPSGFGLTGFGLYLEGPHDEPVDLVGVYPNQPWPTQSECSPLGGNLPNVLDFAAGESWQRVAATGNPLRDWVVAPSTATEPNVRRGPAASAADVVIAEVAAKGPAGSDDDLVELRNDGEEGVDLGGWSLYRCTASGRLRPDTRQLEIPRGTVLEPGATWVAASERSGVAADARWSTSLADLEFGVLLRDADGALVDRVAVSSAGDSACQDPKLPAILDAVAAESYQRTDDGWVAAPRTPGRENASQQHAVADHPFAYPAAPSVAISEFATDPGPEGMPAGTERRNFVELANYGPEPVDIGGWVGWRCEVDGARAIDRQFEVPAGITLPPGGTWLAALEGTPAAARADAVFAVPFDLLGTGVWIEDDRGERADSIGVFALNEMDETNVQPSVCSKGVALTTYQPDRLLEQSFQRSRFTGVDADDFVVGTATPGDLDLVEWVDPTLRVAAAALPAIARTAVARPQPSPAGAPLPVVAAWGGVTDGGPLTTAAGEAESRLDPEAPGTIRDEGYGFPYQRLELDASTLVPGSTISWTGTTVGRGELQFSAWTGDRWRLLDAAMGPDVLLSGRLEEGELRDGAVTLLVQQGPRTEPTLATAPDGVLQDPAGYDFAISHITDTQYLTESYPAVYAHSLSWIAANAQGRKIAFATHTGDIVQNWVSPDQNEQRARREFETASDIQRILEDAGLPHSVLPGNHDNKRGASNDLFNAYFGPDRYADSPWYGGSIAPGDNSANFSTFEHDGAKFLMLSLPYAYADREIDWAAEVVEAHPEFNVIVSTHEHVTPKTLDGPAHRSGASRWVSRGEELWDRVIAPNRNVVLVLSGHFHGIGALVTEDAGGLPGHDVVELLADYQEFRTHTGERATGFQRLLQVDLASGGVAVDTFSVRLDANASFDYDYRQFLPDNGSATLPSNVRPWRIVEAGLQHRYTIEDDEFVATVAFQFPKAVSTSGVFGDAGLESRGPKVRPVL